MENIINKNLPYKKKIFENSNNNLGKYDQYYFCFGKNVNDNIFNKNIGEQHYLNILNYLSSIEYDKIIQNDCKHYYYNDLQMIINSHGIQWCKKDKIYSYSTFQSYSGLDLRLELYKSYKISTDYFPPIINYNNIKKVQKTRYIKDNISFEITVNSFRNKEISYEFAIFANKNNLKELLNIIKNINKNLKLFNSLKYIKSRNVENYEISKLSLSVK